MTRTLITGAAGFTGRYLTSLLAAQGCDVHAVVHRVPNVQIPGAVAIHVADLTDHGAIAQVVAEVRPQHVVHLAAIAFVGHDDIGEMYRANVVGTRHLLDALSQLENSPASVLLASSANVYGNAREGILDETTPPAPANDYGVSKVAAEYVARLYASKLPLIIARPFNYTGRGQANNFLIPKIVAHTRNRASVISLGNVEVERDFSDVRAVVAAYARLLNEPNAIGGTFNICSGRAYSLREILVICEKLSGHHLSVHIDPALVRSNDVRSLSGSIKKLSGVIGPLRSIPLDETIDWMMTAQ